MEEKVLEILQQKGEPMRPGEIVAAAAADKKDVDKAIKSLVKQEKVFSPKRCFYAAK